MIPTPIKHLSCPPLRLSTILFTLLFIAACSGSTTTSTTTPSPNTALSDGADSDSPSVEASADSNNDSADLDITGDINVSQPVEQVATLVHFDITVPAYVSNELQVRLRWGYQDINAIWVADESWTLSDYFAKDAEHLLVVTFSDKNGGIILGSFETTFKPDGNNEQLYQIAADDFDTGWDSDGDGVTNLEESVNGSNPLFDNTINNDYLRSLLPNHTMLFGQDISDIPDPDYIVHDSLFSWRYEVVGDQLIGSGYEAPLAHRTAWQRYVELTLPEHRKVINVVKFLYAPTQNEGPFVITIDPKTAPGQATVELQFTERFTDKLFTAHQQSQNNSYPQTLALLWSHASVMRSSQLIKYSHEYDVPTYSLTAGGRVLWDSWLRDYYWQFWNGEVIDTWIALGSDSSKRHVMRDTFPDTFITSYAASSPYADFNASFEYFVKSNSMPTPGEFAGADKIIWFWNQPEFVNIRSYARAAF